MPLPLRPRREDARPLVKAIAEELARFGGGSVNAYLHTAQALLRDAVRSNSERDVHFGTR